MLHLGDATWSYTTVTHLVHEQLCSLYKVSSQPGIPLLTSLISFHTTSYGRKNNALLPCAGLLHLHFFQRPLCKVEHATILPFQLLASPHLYFMHFSALSLLRRLVMVWEWHWEQDAQKSLTFIILLFQTASKKQLYGRLLSKLRKCQTCQCSQVLFLLVRTCLHVTIDCQQHGMWSTGHCGMKHLTWPSRCSQKRKPNNLGQGKSEKWINGKRR